jgi:hypothetical protein
MHRSKKGLLFDYLVGAAEQRVREGDAERLGGLQVEYQLNLRGLHNRQVGRLHTLEDLSRVDADQAICIGQAASVALFQKPNRVSGLFSASCAANRFAAAKLWPWVAVTFTTETAGAVSGVVLADAVTVKLVDQLLHCAPSLTRTHKCRYPKPA